MIQSREDGPLEASDHTPPNEAAAAFKEHIEEKLRKDAYGTQLGDIYYIGPWETLGAESKLREIATAMDWERVPESYFVAMVERELDPAELPDEKRAALQSPKENRHLFSEGFGGGIAESANPEPESRPVRDTTLNLFQSLVFDTWPRAGAIVDFGLDSQEHYEALYYPVRNDEITAEMLDEAIGNGPKLTELARDAPSNPHKDIEFHTSYDILRAASEPEDIELGDARYRPPSPSEIGGDDTPALPEPIGAHDTSRGR